MADLRTAPAATSGLLEVDVDVPAGLERTFAAATDWPAQAGWIPLTRVGVVAGDGRSEGSVVHAFTGVGRAGFLDVMRITRWDPPDRVDVLHVGRFLRGPGRFGFTARPDGTTRFRWSEDIELPLGALGRAAWPVVRPLAAFALRAALRRFARSVVA
jgi:hypothetical protein